MEALSVSVACRVTILIATTLLPMLLTSCGKKGPDGEKKTAQKSEDDFLDKDAKPDERKYLLAAKPFFIAIANRKYADAYALLSRYAIARMSSISLSLLSRTLMFSKTNRMHSTT